MRPTRRTALGLFAALPTAALAQAWPSRPIRCIVPSAAGGYDTYARIMAPRLAERLGQPVVIDNKPGANGIIAMQEVQRSPADGHVIMFGHIGAITVNTAIYPNMPLDPVADLAAVAVAVNSPMVWVANPAAPFHTMAELVARVRAAPGEVRYALPASGSINHLVAEAFKYRHRLDLPAVPYRTTPQAQTDVIAGQVPLMLDSLGAGWGHISSGRVRPLAVTSQARSPRLPEVPSMVELGLDPREFVAWYAYMTPKGVPAALVQRLNQVVNEVLAEAEVAEKIAGLGATPRQSTPEGTLAFMREEQRTYAVIVREAGIKVE